MIKIKDLKANVETDDGAVDILKGITLDIPDGEVHAIMGPNGSGKSTLSYVLAGQEDYDVTGGSATLDGEDLLEMSPEERAAAGLFLAFQYPVEIPGVNMSTFLKTSINSIRKQRGEKELDALGMLKLIKTKCAELGIRDDMMKRAVNVGFSGGEKKRNEVLQMAMLEPKFCVLDETDSGLDIDALKVVADGVNALRDPKRSFLIITKTGGPELALELEKKGYSEFVEEAA